MTTPKKQTKDKTKPPAASKNVAARKPLTNAEKRKKAEELFVFNMMNAKQIHELMGVSEKTLGKWRDEDNWDKQREEVLTNPNAIRQILLKEALSIAQGNAPTIQTDALSKVLKGLETLAQEISPQVIVAVIQLLDNWTAERYPSLAVDSLPVHKEFLREMISVHD